MSKVLDRVRKLPWVAYVDDEREDGSSIIVTLNEGYEFAGNEGCGVQGFDTVAQAQAETRKCFIVAVGAGAHEQQPGRSRPHTRTTGE